MTYGERPICAHCHETAILGDPFCTHCGWRVAFGAPHAGAPTPSRTASFPDGYRPLQEGGRGASSIVWLATHERTGQRVAVKELHGDSGLQDRFIREAAINRKLSHGSIVPQLGAWLGVDRMFSVMPWIEGASLRELLDGEGPFEVAEVLWILQQLADALAAAHALRIIHRDVKPANILIDLTGAPLLCDFGIAKQSDEPDVTHAGAAVGSPAYMAPEQLRGLAVPASDQYALGVVCFESLIGHRPYLGSTAEVQRSHLYEPVPSLQGRFDGAGIPFSDDIADVVARLLQKSPEERFPDAGAVARAVASLRAFDSAAARVRLASRVARARVRRAMIASLATVGAADTSSAPVDVAVRPVTAQRATPAPERAAVEAAPVVEEATLPTDPAEPASAGTRVAPDSMGEWLVARRFYRYAPRFLAGAALVWVSVWAIVNVRPQFVAETDTQSAIPSTVTSDSAASARATTDAPAPPRRDSATLTPPPANRLDPVAPSRDMALERRPLSARSDRAVTATRTPVPPADSEGRTVAPRSAEALATPVSKPEATVIPPNPPADAPVVSGESIRRDVVRLLGRTRAELSDHLDGAGQKAFVARLARTRWPAPARVDLDSVAGGMAYLRAEYALTNTIGRPERGVAIMVVPTNDRSGRWLSVLSWQERPQ